MSLSATADRFVVAAREVMSGSKAYIEYRILRIVRTHTNSLLYMVDRLVRSAVKRERQTEIAVRGGEAWVEIECSLEFIYRLVGAPPVVGRVAEGEVSPRVAVVKLRCPGGEGCRLLALAAP